MSFEPGLNGIQFENLTYRVPNPLQKNEDKVVLNSLSGCFRSGELTGILGSSGAGKSSLLNILTGFTKQGVTGTITMHNTTSTSKHYGQHCSYILQEDHLYGNFTVQETMWLAANLKIANQTQCDKQSTIDIVLDMLHLQHSRRTRCGNLSGGQRKRLSIALELLDNRPILLLDEPTTGLDSLAATYCMRLLRNLTLEGRTIVCTIHQPAATIYEMFDQVFVLGAGHCLYQGSADNTVAYLASNQLRCPQYHNAADFIIECVSGEYGDHNQRLAISARDPRWLQTVKNTSTTVIEPMVNGVFMVRETPTEWTKFCVLVRRCGTNCYRDWIFTYIKWVMHVFTAILFGIIYGDSGSNASKSLQNLSLLYACNIYIWYTAVLPSVLNFPSEIQIVRKETFNHWYRLHTYYFAHMLVYTPILVISSVMFSTIVYTMTDQPADWSRFLRFSAVLVLSIIVSDRMGLAIGAVLDPVNGTFVASMISTFKISLSGFLAMPSQVSGIIRMVMHFSTISYSQEALTLAIYDNHREDVECPSTEMYCHYRSASEILKMIGFNVLNYEYDIVMLILQIFLIKCISYALLRWRIRSNF